jgi:hypothetical protein
VSPRLEEIVAATRERVERCKAERPLADLERVVSGRAASDPELSEPPKVNDSGGVSMMRAPCARAMSSVPSLDPESTTIVSTSPSRMV